MQSDNSNKLERGLSLTQATSINMIDMVGIGPFITISLIVGLMNGPICILAWLLGALLAFLDGMVWSELGAKWPEAGGSYVFLRKLYGEKTLGAFMAFLFIWQTTIQAPLVVASGTIGFAQYLTYLVPLTPIQMKMVSGGLVILLVALLYRNIQSIGKISVLLWIITGGTILWLIFSGIGHFNAAQAFNWSTAGFNSDNWGKATQKAMYAYLGYYNVCHLGAEIKKPEKNIPRSIFISIAGIAILYLCMQVMILGVLPWQQVANSKFIASTYFEYIYNPTAGKIATMLILCIALASLFSVILGYSRVPYAAAKNGDFFPAFARVHSKHKFPYVSLLVLGGLAFIFSVFFNRLSDVITAILVMRILIQFVSQTVGLIIWRYKRPKEERPFKMWLFPIPALFSICIWLFIFYSSETKFKLFALYIIASGALLFFLKKYFVTGKDKQINK